MAIYNHIILLTILFMKQKARQFFCRGSNSPYLRKKVRVSYLARALMLIIILVLLTINSFAQLQEQTIDLFEKHTLKSWFSPDWGDDNATIEYSQLWENLVGDWSMKLSNLSSTKGWSGYEASDPSPLSATQIMLDINNDCSYNYDLKIEVYNAQNQKIGERILHMTAGVIYNDYTVNVSGAVGRLVLVQDYLTGQNVVTYIDNIRIVSAGSEIVWDECEVVDNHYNWSALKDGNTGSSGSYSTIVKSENMGSISSIVLEWNGTTDVGNNRAELKSISIDSLNLSEYDEFLIDVYNPSSSNIAKLSIYSYSGSDAITTDPVIIVNSSKWHTIRVPFNGDPDTRDTITEISIIINGTDRIIDANGDLVEEIETTGNLYFDNFRASVGNTYPQETPKTSFLGKFKHMVNDFKSLEGNDFYGSTGKGTSMTNDNPPVPNATIDLSLSDEEYTNYTTAKSLKIHYENIPNSVVYYYNTLGINTENDTLSIYMKGDPETVKIIFHDKNWPTNKNVAYTYLNTVSSDQWQQWLIPISLNELKVTSYGGFDMDSIKEIVIEVQNTSNSSKTGNLYVDNICFIDRTDHKEGYSGVVFPQETPTTNFPGKIEHMVNDYAKLAGNLFYGSTGKGASMTNDNPPEPNASIDLSLSNEEYSGYTAASSLDIAYDVNTDKSVVHYYNTLRQNSEKDSLSIYMKGDPGIVKVVFHDKNWPKEGNIAFVYLTDIDSDQWNQWLIPMSLNGLNTTHNEGKLPFDFDNITEIVIEIENTKAKETSPEVGKVGHLYIDNISFIDRTDDTPPYGGLLEPQETAKTTFPGKHIHMLNDFSTGITGNDFYGSSGFGPNTATYNTQIVTSSNEPPYASDEVLQLHYDVEDIDNSVFYYNTLRQNSAKDTLSISLKGDPGIVKLEFHDINNLSGTGSTAYAYLKGISSTEWQQWLIPIDVNKLFVTAIKDVPPFDFNNIIEVVVAVENTTALNTTGDLYIDNMYFVDRVENKVFYPGNHLPQGILQEDLTVYGNNPHLLKNYNDNDTVTNNFYGSCSVGYSSYKENDQWVNTASMHQTIVNDGGTRQSALELTYNVQQPESYTFYVNRLSLNTAKDKFVINMRSENENTNPGTVKLEFKDDKKGTGFCFLHGITSDWKQWVIPINSTELYKHRNIPFDLTNINEVVVTLTNAESQDKIGKLYIDDLTFVDQNDNRTLYRGHALPELNIVSPLPDYVHVLKDYEGEDVELLSNKFYGETGIGNSSIWDELHKKWYPNSSLSQNLSEGYNSNNGVLLDYDVSGKGSFVYFHHKLNLNTKKNRFAIYMKAASEEENPGTVVLQFKDKFNKGGQNWTGANCLLHGITTEWQQWIVEIDTLTRFLCSENGYVDFDRNFVAEAVVVIDNVNSIKKTGKLHIDGLTFIDQDDTLIGLKPQIGPDDELISLNWDNPEDWIFKQEPNSSASISSFEGVNNDGIVLDYDFTNAKWGWATLRMKAPAEFDQNNNPLAFYIKHSTGDVLDVKFIDTDGSFFGASARLLNNNEWTRVVTYLKDMAYLYESDNTFGTLDSIIIAIAGGGTKGKVWFDEIGIAPEGTLNTMGIVIDPNSEMSGIGPEQRRDDAMNPEDPFVLEYLKELQDATPGENLIPSELGGVDTIAHTFNNSMVAIAFILKGERLRAERILDFYSNATDVNNDDIRKQNFFYNGEARGFYQSISLKTKRDETENGSDRWMGDMVWLLSAYKMHEKQYDDNKYENIIKLLTDLLVSFYSPAGFIQSGWRKGDKYLHEPGGHHEGNIDAYGVLKHCGVDPEITYSVKQWLENELTVKKLNKNLPLDLYTWRVLAYGGEQVDLLNIPEYDFRYRKSMNFNGKNVVGLYSFPENFLVNIWPDGVGHIACAYLAYGDKNRGYYYANQMDNMLIDEQVVEGGTTTKSIPYALDNLPPYEWVNTKKGFVSVAAWYIFAKNEFNPFGVENYKDPNQITTVARWYMDENEGTEIVDATGQGNNGVISGASWSHGIRKSGLYFDNNDDIDCGNNGDLNIMNDVTIEAWIKLDAASSDSYILSKASASENKYSFGVLNTGEIFFSNGNETNNGGVNVRDNKWHHVVVTCNGSIGTFYVDGSADDTFTYSGIPDNINETLHIGSYNNQSNHFYGTIDEVALWSKALTVSEIQGNYNTNKPVDEPIIPKLFQDSYHAIKAMRHSNGVYNDAIALSGIDKSAAIVANGVGLVSLCIADAMYHKSGDAVNWEADAAAMVDQTLTQLINFMHAGHVNEAGLFPRYFNVDNGEIVGPEYSTIDCAIFAIGVVMCKNYFSGHPSIVEKANLLLSTMDFTTAIENNKLYMVLDKNGDININTEINAFNEYMLVPWLAKNSSVLNPGYEKTQVYWNEYYSNPKTSTNITRNTYGEYELIGDHKDAFLSSFAIQLPYYYCHYFKNNTDYMEYFDNARKADSLWYRDVGVSNSYEWGTGAGDIPGGGYIADAIERNPDKTVSPGTIGGFIPIYPQAKNDLVSLYNMGNDPAVYNLPDDSERKVLWRYKQSDADLRCGYIQSVDYSYLLYGLATLPEFLGPDFFDTYNNISESISGDFGYVEDFTDVSDWSVTEGDLTTDGEIANLVSGSANSAKTISDNFTIDLDEHPYLQIDIAETTASWQLILVETSTSNEYVVQQYTKETGVKSYNVKSLFELSGQKGFSIHLSVSSEQDLYVKMDQVDFRSTAQPFGYYEDFEDISDWDLISGTLSTNDGIGTLEVLDALEKGTMINTESFTINLDEHPEMHIKVSGAITEYWTISLIVNGESYILQTPIDEDGLFIYDVKGFFEPFGITGQQSFKLAIEVGERKYDFIDMDYILFGKGNYNSNNENHYDIFLDVPYTVNENPLYNSAACAKMILDYQTDNSITQSEIYTFDRINNYTTNQSADFIDPYGMYRGLNHFETDSRYNYAQMSRNSKEEAYHDICYWISNAIRNTSREHLPSVVPVNGNFNQWFVINGFQSSANPHVKSDYTVYGFYVSDPSIDGVGSNMFIQANTFGTYYYQSISSTDIWNGRYVSVNEPPLESNMANIEMERDVIEPSTNELRYQIASNAFYDYKLNDKEGIATILADGFVEDRIYFVDLEGTLNDYYIVTYTRAGAGGVILVAIIDANNGALKLMTYNEPDYNYYTYLDNYNDAVRLKSNNQNAHGNDLLYPKNSLSITNVTENKLSSREQNDFNFTLMPNPASNFTRLNYTITKDGMVNINIYNLTGKIVRTVSNSYQQAGNYTLELDLQDLEKGVYLCRFINGKELIVKKLIVNK